MSALEILEVCVPETQDITNFWILVIKYDLLATLLCLYRGNLKNCLKVVNLL